jgi:Flp pilus assembly protein TadD
MTALAKTLFSICLIIIALHLWGAIQPTHFNWGVHIFAFYDTVVSMVVLMAALVLFVPRSRDLLMRAGDGVLALHAKLPPLILFIAAAGILVVLAFVCQSQGLLLGDSKLILLTTSQIPNSTEVSANYRNQPLFLLALRYAGRMISQGKTADLEAIYRILDLGAGCVFLAAVFLFVRSFTKPPLETFLAGLFLMAGAGTQFFFGYIENYSLLYAFTGMYLVTGYLSLQRKIPFIVPLIFFACMIGFHLGALIFAPTVLVLFLERWRESRREGLLMAGVIALASILVYTASQYSISQFIIRMRDALTYDFLPVLSAPPGIPYAMLSGLHLVDWINANLLILPFGLLPVSSILVVHRGDLRRASWRMLFLLGASACGVLFTLTINPAIGMARDWDLLASFFLPTMFLASTLFLEHLSTPSARGIFFLMVMLTLLHTAGWIGINADKDRHLRRSEILTDPRFMSRFAQLLYYDRLANACWERKDYAEAKGWYERYLAIDSTNPRMVTNFSEVYRRLGERENAFDMLKLAARRGSEDPGVYSNLSVEYFLKGDTSAAITMGERSLALAPGQPHVHANLGIYYLQAKNFTRASEHLASAVEGGIRTPEILRRTGDAYFAQHDVQHALHYYDLFLSLNPNEPAIRSRAAKLREILSKEPQQPGADSGK